jgi:hypothetical protein
VQLVCGLVFEEWLVCCHDNATKPCTAAKRLHAATAITSPWQSTPHAGWIGELGLLGHLMKTTALLFVCGFLLGCKTTDSQPPVAKDVQSITNQLKMVVSFAEQYGMPTLPHVLKTEQAAYEEVRRMSPSASFSEYCEWDGWVIFSRTPTNSPLRFHSGSAVEKGGKRVYTFGFW